MKIKIPIYLFLTLLIPGIIFTQSREVNFTAIEGSAYTNYAYKILEEAYSRLDIQLNVIALPAKRSLISSNAGGDINGELFRISGIERTYTNLIPIEVPLSNSEWIVYTIEHNFVVKGWDSLKPYRIGVRNGIATTDKGTFGMDTEKANTNEQLFTMLKHGRVDIIVMSKTNAAKLLNNRPITQIKALSPPIQIIPVYHFVHKDYMDIIPDLTKVLHTMENEGFIDRIFKEYWALLTN